MGRTLQIRVSAELEGRLKREAALEGLTLSELVRRRVDAGEEVDEGPSALELDRRLSALEALAREAGH